MKTLLFLAAALASFGGLAQNLPGEVVAEYLHRNRIARAIERRTQSKRFSWLRLGYLLSVGLVVAAAVVSINLAFSPAG